MMASSARGHVRVARTSCPKTSQSNNLPPAEAYIYHRTLFIFCEASIQKHLKQVSRTLKVNLPQSEPPKCPTFPPKISFLFPLNFPCDILKAILSIHLERMCNFIGKKNHYISHPKEVWLWMSWMMRFGRFTKKTAKPTTSPRHHLQLPSISKEGALTKSQHEELHWFLGAKTTHQGNGWEEEMSWIPFLFGWEKNDTLTI